MINTSLRDDLISLKEADLALRTQILKAGQLNDGYDIRMEQLHIKNAEKLAEIIEAHGWPGKSVVGEEGAEAAFMLACHAISTPELQRKFFNHIQEAAKNGEATNPQVACLEDRIRFNEGKLLKYGMLFDWNEFGELSVNVENIELANKMRKQMGLKTVEEAKVLHQREIELEGGGPPSDYHKHKRQEHEWAKRMGWR